ncbi:MAG: hypothetical protein A2Y93_07570 [Chloroflexi bacterium RBG_13_68_17]|nr:MAG: hypothetical protein A2Y93_07570 [Chloroflexi bacterium RBG_13_68_17]
MRRHIALVHTSFVLVDVLNSLLDRTIPEARRTHIVEHSILQDVLDAGGLTPAVTRRMLGYFMLAEATGADVIFNACSSVGETVDIARHVVRIPIVKIDDAMAEEAVRAGHRIGVIATLKTTLDPTCRLVQQHADHAGAQVEIVRSLCDGAFDLLSSGQSEAHDQMVREKLIDLGAQVDVIVLAQASMARVAPSLPEGAVTVPVLSSPESGVRHLRELVDSL